MRKVLIETKMQSVLLKINEKSHAPLRVTPAANLSSSSPWSARSTRKSSTSTHASSAAYATCRSVKGLWLQSLMRVDLSRGLPSTAAARALSPTACLRR